MLADGVAVEILDEPAAALELGPDDLWAIVVLPAPERPVNQRVKPSDMCLPN